MAFCLACLTSAMSCVPPFMAVAGTIAGVGGLYYGARTLHTMSNHYAATNATEQWSKNSCTIDYSTGKDLGVFYGYSYKAWGIDLDCKNVPELHVIQKEVKSCAKRWRDHDIDYGCCKKTIGKGHWQIQVSRNPSFLPEWAEC